MSNCLSASEREGAHGPSVRGLWGLQLEGQGLFRGPGEELQHRRCSLIRQGFMDASRLQCTTFPLMSVCFYPHPSSHQLHPAPLLLLLSSDACVTESTPSWLKQCQWLISDFNGNSLAAPNRKMWMKQSELILYSRHAKMKGSLMFNITSNVKIERPWRNQPHTLFHLMEIICSFCPTWLKTDFISAHCLVHCGEKIDWTLSIISSWQILKQLK